MALVDSLECDRCRFRGDDTASPVSSVRARKNARKQGWYRTHRGADLCPECAKPELERDQQIADILVRVACGETD